MEVREMAAAAAAAAAGGGGGGGGRLPPPNPNLPYREDCWSEGETAALVDAWGSRYLELNRGNLRQKQWQEVADAVNSRRGAAARRRPPRTDVQCKNRVDTLKKKYKAERARTLPSSWPFFSQLDILVGPTLIASASKKPSPSPSPHLALPFPPSSMRKPPSPSPSPSPPPPMALPLPNYRRGSPLPAAAFIQKAAAAAAAAASDSEDSDDGNNNNNNNNNSQQSGSRSVSSRSGNNKRSRRESSGDGGFRELARAIEAFAEMYERVEGAKQRQAVEMERQRIEFLKGLELQRMQSFVDAQVRLEKAKRARKRSGAAVDATGAAELLGSVAALPFLSTPTYL